MTTVEHSLHFVEQLLDSLAHRPLVIGVSGPQGSGKLYLAAHLVDEIHRTRPQVAAVGMLLDDFYWTHAQQAQVLARARHDGNLLLQGRGLPGTHDLQLLRLVVAALERGGGADVPVYDKGAHGGEGDRAPQWRHVARADVVVVEGWFCGFRSLDRATVAREWAAAPQKLARAHLEAAVQAINAQLRAYEPVWDRFDGFVYLAGNVANVYRWRQQQEDALWAASGRGMAPEEVVRFVDRYMPVYYLYYKRMCGAAGARRLGLHIDEHRTVQLVLEGEERADAEGRGEGARRGEEENPESGTETDGRAAARV